MGQLPKFNTENEDPKIIYNSKINKKYLFIQQHVCTDISKPNEINVFLQVNYMPDKVKLNVYKIIIYYFGQRSGISIIFSMIYLLKIFISCNIFF